ncbi:hypothetical protein [Nocardia gipuzkoensis]|uniref:hypothetical protein n=1 Tax=Nocardia gipuzkoensis TaxID=2749991 RepID=UPI002453A66D|nr:hypothetical protein [Nocardia gipuzkoensis]
MTPVQRSTFGHLNRRSFFRYSALAGAALGGAGALAAWGGNSGGAWGGSTAAGGK